MFLLFCGLELGRLAPGTSMPGDSSLLRKLFMNQNLDTVMDDIVLPKKVDVVVIGGGIIGASTALSLSLKGLAVALCEKGPIAGEQSSRNWGWCRITKRDPRELELSIKSVEMWREFEATYGIDTGFRQCGILYAAETDAAMEAHTSWLERARRVAGDTFDTRVLSSDQVAMVLPTASRRFKGGIYTPTDGRAEPEKAVTALVALLRSRGVKVLTPCAARGVETSAGRVSAVVTEHGVIQCQSVVVAGGAWSRHFCGNLGINVPQLLLRASVVQTTPVEGGPDCCTSTGPFAFRKRVDGGYTIANGFSSISELTPDSFRLFFLYLKALKTESGQLKIRFGKRFFEELLRRRSWQLDEKTVFEEIRTLDPEPAGSDADIAFEQFIELFPQLKTARIAQRWGGYMDVTPDALPVISGVESIPGFFIGTGFSGHGFGIGPAAGRLLADLVTNDQPLVNPHVFRLGRFFDGSEIILD